MGRRLVEHLDIHGFSTTVAVRKPESAEKPESTEKASFFLFEDLSADQDWQKGLAGHEVVVHCAGRAHVMNEQAADPLAEFRRVNVDGTLNLAQQAAAAGVKRFVFLSSIKVNGEETRAGQPYTAFDAPAPQDPYGVSKWEAEQGLRSLAKATGMELVIIRPVLVYGPGVKANFRSMMKWVHNGVPLPLGAVNNKRSFVYIDNLVDLIRTCIEHPAAAGQTFLVSDDKSLSIPQLLRLLSVALESPARLIPVPAVVLNVLASLIGKGPQMRRLSGSLEVDICHTCTTLNWTPPASPEDGFHATARAFLTE